MASNSWMTRYYVACILLMVTLMSSDAQASTFIAHHATVPISKGECTPNNRFLPGTRRLLPTNHHQVLSKQQQWLLPLRGGASNTRLFSGPVVFANGPFWQSALTFVAVNGLGFAISLLSGGSHVHLDLLGTGAFALAAIPQISSSIPRIQLSSACVAVWGTKLASFLFFRAKKVHRDERLEETLSTVSGTMGFWVVSLLWGLLCSLPQALGTTSSHNVPVSESPCGVIGTGMFVLGLVIETLADVQKWSFKQSNPGKFCNSGLWSISQHPNFFGNLLIWTGILVLNAPALVDPAPSAAGASVSIWQTVWSYRRLALAALSPMFLWTLFFSQAKGSLTPALELSSKKYGNDPAYEAYLRDVPLIIPNIMLAFRKK